MNQQASTHKKYQTRVLMIPDNRQDNPYQELLANFLKAERLEVNFPQGYRRGLPIFRALKNQPKTIHILHLHWLNPYLKGKNWVIRLIYCFKFLLDLQLAHKKDCKIIWTVHNSLPHETQFPRIELWIRRRLAKLVDRIIIHQACSVEEISNLYQFDSKKVTVIPHGNYRQTYQSSVSQLEARNYLGLPLKGLIYLNLGLLRPYKGVDELLQVWEENQKSFQEDTLVIAGKAGKESYGILLQEKVSRLKGVILHDHFIEDELIHFYFSAADFVICPFRKILTSGSIILAMSYRRPIIAPNFPSIAETLGSANWLLYNPEESQGLSNAIKKSREIDWEGLSTLVNQECNRLNWDNIAQQTSQLYLNLISQEDNKDNSEVVAGVNETDR